MLPVCNLCENVRHVVERGELWTLAPNRNQNLPSKSVLVLNRHCERAPALTAEEWARLRPYTGRVTSALDTLFAPDLYDFAFLMNKDAHEHLHIVPRYASPVAGRNVHGRALRLPVRQGAAVGIGRGARRAGGGLERPALATPAGSGSVPAAARSGP